MQPKASMLIKILLNRFHPGATETLLKYLPSEEATVVQEQTASFKDPTPLFTLSKDIVARTHYSWLVPTFQKLPPWKQQMIVTALPESQSSGLRHLLKIGGHRFQPSPALKTFLLNKLYEIWNPWKDTLPLAFLPPSPLTPLLEYSKNKLVELVDLLAMHDLSESIRHIVDKNQLKAIYNCLSPGKQQFLRICLHKKEKVTSPKLEIGKWDGDQKKLEQILHKRGLLRFGKALCGQDPQFFWYITRTFDTGRGAALARYYQEEPIPEISSLLIQQVLSLMNFLKQKDQS